MITVEEISKMPYFDFLAHLDENNRPPGGKDTLRLLVKNTFLSEKSNVLVVACNSGYSTFEVAHLSKCKITGLDINKKAIETAHKFLKQYHSDIKDRVNFVVGDGSKLPFKNNSFDLTFSAGGTAFIPDFKKALREYERVTKPWGFVSDIIFFNHTRPPKKLLNKINNLIGTNFQYWPMEYWIEQYKKTGLEIYYYVHEKLKPASEKKLNEYCHYLVNQKDWDKKVKEIAFKRLYFLMDLFNENHKYLSYGVFIMRKRPYPEVTLF